MGGGVGGLGSCFGPGRTGFGLGRGVFGVWEWGVWDVFWGYSLGLRIVGLDFWVGTLCCDIGGLGLGLGGVVWGLGGFGRVVLGLEGGGFGIECGGF